MNNVYAKAAHAALAKDLRLLADYVECIGDVPGALHCTAHLDLTVQSADALRNAAKRLGLTMANRSEWTAFDGIELRRDIHPHGMFTSADKHITSGISLILKGRSDDIGTFITEQRERRVYSVPEGILEG